MTMPVSAASSERLRNAFAAAHASRPAMLAVGTAADDPTTASTNTFESNTHDAQLQFDYNNNPTAVPTDVETQLRFVMQIVQQQATNALAAAGKDFTHDSEVWIQYFAKYPLLFNFRGRDSKQMSQDDFSLSVNSELVAACIDPAAPAAVAAAFVDALQKSGGELLAVTTKTKNLEYLALIRMYDKASVLSIYKAELHMQVVDVKSICASVKNVNLNMLYDRVDFEINNALAQAIYPELSKEAADIATKYLTEFFQQYAAQEFKQFADWLAGLGK